MKCILQFKKCNKCIFFFVLQFSFVLEDVIHAHDIYFRQNLIVYLLICTCI